MGEDPSIELSIVLEIDREHRDFLAPIRHWPLLKLAVDQQTCWVKGLSVEQLQTTEVRAIPFKRLFYEKDNRLYPYGSLLPTKRLPSALIWISLERGLPLTLPAFNHNYFGVNARLTVALAASDTERPTAAQMITLKLLEQYLPSMAPVRLHTMEWVVIDDLALIVGEPLLPLPGRSWWRLANSYLPAGYEWEWDVRVYLPADSDDRLFWNPDGSYLSVPTGSFRPLSLSSFRLTWENLQKTGVCR